jgi:hypothetical protein
MSMNTFDGQGLGGMNFDFTGLVDAQGRIIGSPGYGTGAISDVSSPVYAGGVSSGVFNEAAPLIPTAPVAPEMSTTPAAAPTFSSNPDALNTINTVLEPYGLGALSNTLWTNYTSGLVDITNPAALIYSIKNDPLYKQRFKANDARTNINRPGGPLPELSPQEYIDLEDGYKEVMRVNGLPAGFYDSLDDIEKLIEGTVAPAELQRRINAGYNAVKNADPEVLRQFKEMYGVSDGQLAAYFIDPVRGEPLIQQQAQAANIAARGLESGGIQLSRATAEDLAARGYSPEAISTSFGNIGKLGELTTQMAGETALSQGQIVGSAFGYDTQASQELERRKRLRVGEFQGGGSFARTQGENAGSITTSVGTAQ